MNLNDVPFKLFLILAILVLQNACARELTLTSSDIVDGRFPVKLTCVGENLSPQLSWSGSVDEPIGSYAITMVDTDCSPVCQHWIIYDIPSEVTSLETDSLTPEDAALGYGYFGPCPGGGDASVRHYEIEIWALEERNLLGADNEPAALYNKIIKNSLGSGILSATFSRFFE